MGLLLLAVAQAVAGLHPQTVACGEKRSLHKKVTGSSETSLPTPSPLRSPNIHPLFTPKLVRSVLAPLYTLVTHSHSN